LKGLCLKKSNIVCYQKHWLAHGAKKYLVELSCITAEKSVVAVFQSITVVRVAAPLIGGAVSRKLFLMLVVLW
jgi:hypothetical protein